MSSKNYRLESPDRLITPCVLVYPDVIQANLEASIRIAGGTSQLRPHVKTHKTPQIVQMQLDLGIVKHKCATLREAQVLAECRAPDVLIAYPQVGPAIERLSRLVKEFPETRFSTTVDDMDAAIALEEAMRDIGGQIAVLVDIDNGMHRTGVPAGPLALDLYERISASDSLLAGGLHVYDGQNHQPSLEERTTAVAELMKPVLSLVEKLQVAGLSVPKLVCGGTPTFPVFAGLEPIADGIAMEFSPGTCVLSDYNYGKDYPDITGIEHAAVLMTRVISKQPGSGQLTCDLGNKAVAADPPTESRCHFLDLPGAKLVKQNEEHLIVSAPDADRFRAGDVLYALPGHVCPTMALHREVHVVRDGQVVDHWEVTARDRIYH